MIKRIVNYILKRVALAKGFVDPFKVMASLQGFQQPSDVFAPIELLRLASVLQVRGLVNAQAIQHNLDWVWPYWVERQFNPKDISFVPRAFSMTHINLTHRNWTGVGIPEFTDYPIVDPAGLFTPLYDGWSVDCWIYAGEDKILIPSRLESVDQSLSFENGMTVTTKSQSGGLSLKTQIYATQEKGQMRVHMDVEGRSDCDAKLVLSIRPMNPEGVSFIRRIEWLDEEVSWRVNRKDVLHVSEKPEKVLFSKYSEGDVFGKLESENKLCDRIKCRTEMATSAAVFNLESDVVKTVSLSLTYPQEDEPRTTPSEKTGWDDYDQKACQFEVPDPKFKHLFDAALRTMVLLSPGADVFPGPYTYKHFWFRDAAFISNALLVCGFHEKSKSILDSFPDRQKSNGYFASQDGEWDSNGEALWAMSQYCELMNVEPPESWRGAIKKGVQWMIQKRLPNDLEENYAGLFPPGFSAEHLGPNDYYYWDDFWGVRGFYAASDLFKRCGDTEQQAEMIGHAEDFMFAIEKSLSKVKERTGSPAMPAAPGRRMDTGAIGSIAAGYPLLLFEGQDERLLETAEFLIKNCFVQGGFFHDMSHSGINAYLTLEIAQVLLRAGDPRYFDLMSSIADLASATGQWPEAVHPATLGGCMGDGHHVWASAEWVLMMRSCFVQEEDESLILCAGIPEKWIEKKEAMRFGPTLTKFGSITVFIDFDGQGEAKVRYEGDWHDEEPDIQVSLRSIK